MSPRTRQVLMAVASLASAAAITYFTKSGWVWAPTIVALMTELRTAFGLTNQPSISAAEVKGRVTGAVPPVAVLLLICSLGFGSCKTGAPVDGGQTPVQAFGHCSTDALRTASEGLLGRVTTALAVGDYVDQIAALTAQVGAAEVGCAVDLLIAEFSKKAARSDDVQVQVILAHAYAIRGSNP